MNSFATLQAYNNVVAGEDVPSEAGSVVEPSQAQSKLVVTVDEELRKRYMVLELRC